MVYRHILNFWSLVPAVDILTIYNALKITGITNELIENLDLPFSDFQIKCGFESAQNLNRKDSMKILIVGDGLGCLIKTMSRMHRHGCHNLHIYVVSNFPESFVRSLLLLSLFTEYPSSISIIEKSEIFLEIFGNTFLRASTSSFVETKAADILNDIASVKSQMRSVPNVSLSYLKQMEIDEICKVLAFLKKKECTYDVANAWENALRSFYGIRYDSRKNLFDYHFNMKLSEYPVINLRKYLEWCETGIAFKLRKAKYDNSNKTFCINSLSTKGKTSEFHGEITTSPYITFGVESKIDGMFNKMNNQYVCTSEDVSKSNVIDFMNEFAAFEKSSGEKTLNIYCLMYPTFLKTRKLEEHFDAVYVTCDMTNYAENGLVRKALNKSGIAVFETVWNVVNSTKEQKIKHSENIEHLAKINGLVAAKTPKCFENNFKLFVLNDCNE